MSFVYLYEWWILIWHIHLKKERKKTDTYYTSYIHMKRSMCAKQHQKNCCWWHSENDECWRAQSRMTTKKIASLIFINKSHHGSSHNWTFDRNGVDKQINTPRIATATMVGQPASQPEEKKRNKNKTLCSNIFLNVTDLWWHIIFAVLRNDNNTHTHTYREIYIYVDLPYNNNKILSFHKLLFYWIAPPVALRRQQWKACQQTEYWRLLKHKHRIIISI